MYAPRPVEDGDGEVVVVDETAAGRMVLEAELGMVVDDIVAEGGADEVAAICRDVAAAKDEEDEEELATAAIW